MVRTVSNASLQPGEQAVAWDGRGGNRKPVGTGRYVARVTATNELGVVSLTQSLTVRRVTALARPTDVSTVRRCSSPPSSASSPTPSRRSSGTTASTRSSGSCSSTPFFRRRASSSWSTAARSRRGVCRPGRHALRAHHRRGLRPAYVVDRARRNDRLHARLDDGLGDRVLRRPPVPRAPRPLAAPQRGEARPGGALVRALGGLGRVLRRLTPVIRSFVSIPAGVFEARFVRYTLLTLLGSAIWCFSSPAPAMLPERRGRTSTMRSATSSTSSRPRSSAARPGSAGGI